MGLAGVMLMQVGSALVMGLLRLGVELELLGMNISGQRSAGGLALFLKLGALQLQAGLLKGNVGVVFLGLALQVLGFELQLLLLELNHRVLLLGLILLSGLLLTMLLE